MESKDINYDYVAPKDSRLSDDEHELHLALGALSRYYGAVSNLISCRNLRRAQAAAQPKRDKPVVFRLNQWLELAVPVSWCLISVPQIHTKRWTPQGCIRMYVLLCFAFELISHNT